MKTRFSFPNLLLAVFLAFQAAATAGAQPKAVTEAEIAARFAPVFHQALGEHPRSDFITNFDFDGDWRGDNNWDNVDNKLHRLQAYVYYSLSETVTHYFIHYAVFHPRDYKGGEQRGRLLSDLLRQGAKVLGNNDPTGMMQYATAAHENDMEGVLVVVAKNGDGVVFVETVAHNSFDRYSPGESRPAGVGAIKIEDGRPLLYIEPRGHGIAAYSDSVERVSSKGSVIYRYTGQAEDPENIEGKTVGYDLVPIKSTLWPKAVGLGTRKGITYGSVHDYAQISINMAGAKGKATLKKVKIGGVGSTFLGGAGGTNMARPPWGWFDTKRRTDPLGLWFFDPAKVIRRNFGLGEDFSTAYVRPPFWAGK